MEAAEKGFSKSSAAPPSPHFNKFDSNFNEKKSFYYKAAFKLREQASTLLKQAKRASDNYQNSTSESVSILNSTKSSKSKKSNKLDSTSASISTDASMLSPSSSISAH